MKKKIVTGLVMACLITILPSCKTGTGEKLSILFYSYAENPEQLNNVFPLVESIRTFAGNYRDATIWVYLPETLLEKQSETTEKLASFNVEIKPIEVPAEAAWFFLSGKVFAAAKAEAEAEGKTAILVFLNHDTVVLQEPDEFNLVEDKKFGFRPVMHKNVGLLYSEPVDSFWRRIYDNMSVDESTLFPMVTPADLDTIRPYFNAGLLVVRPGERILRKWADYYTLLYQDSVLKEMCEKDIRKRIFLHQTALTGAVLNHLENTQILEFSERINYPIFFNELFGAKRDFHDISNIITFRHETYFRNPAPDWYEQLKGPEDKIEWMKKHMIRN